MLEPLEALLAGLWLGSYLFTHLIVSPALKSLSLTDGERVGLRSQIGRRYGRLAAPLLLVWLAVLMFQGPSGWALVRLALLVLLIVAVGVHGYLLGGRMQALAAREAAGHDPAAAEERARLQRLSARVTPVSLVLSLALAALTLVWNG